MRFIHLIMLLAALPLSAVESPFTEGTHRYLSAEEAQFGEELVAELSHGFLTHAMKSGRFVIENLPLSDGRLIDVDLTAFEPLSPGAMVIEMSDEGPIIHEPNRSRSYFKGYSLNDIDSVAYFVTWGTGFSGFVQIDGVRYIYGVKSGDNGKPLAAVCRFVPGTAPEKIIQCLNDHNDEVDDPYYPGSSGQSGIQLRVPSSGTLKADLALDMDYEAYTHFGSVQAAEDYATDLTAAISVFYERDADTIIGIANIVVWTSTGAPYPYTASTPATLLPQIKAYYMANMGGVTRATAILLSLKNLGGGIAYRCTGGCLCDNSWGYGIIGIHGTYSYPTASYTWDADGYAHELGHNFGSSHTHCYQDPPGTWLDCCYGSEGGCCTSAAESDGTIMSYCHLWPPYDKPLIFHDYVKPIIRTGAVNGACVLEAGSPGTLVEDGSGDGVMVTKQTGTIPVAYSLDDGSVEIVFGYTGTAQAAWINRFTPTQYPVTIDRVDVMIGDGFGTVAAGREIRILVYRDPAGTGSPAGSTLDYTEDVTVQHTSYSTWNSYTLGSPVTVVSGDFYIGFFDRDNDALTTNIVNADTSANQGGSYRTANTTNPSSFSLDTNYNWLIRAFGDQTPGADDILLTWGDPCNVASEPSQSYAVYSKALSFLGSEGYDPDPLTCTESSQSYTANVSGNAYFTVVPLLGPNEGGHGFSRTPTNTCATINPDPSCP